MTKNFVSRAAVFAAGLLVSATAFASSGGNLQQAGTDLEDKWRDQLRWIGIGVPFFFAASLMDYKWIRWACWPAYLIGIGGLIATLAIGVEIGGNKAWIKVGPIMIQPSQFAITAGIISTAAGSTVCTITTNPTKVSAGRDTDIPLDIIGAVISVVCRPGCTSPQVQAAGRYDRHGQ